MNKHHSPSPLDQSSRLRFVESDQAADAHAHFGLLYESRAEQFAVAIPFLEEGLERGERCCYATATNTERDVRDALRAYGVDVEEAIESGALRFRDARELYLDDGEFTMEPMLANVEELSNEVSDRGRYAGLRMAAETSWLHDCSIDHEEFLDYEAHANHLFPQTDLVGLCQFDRTRLPSDYVDGIIRTHPLLTVRETVTANPYYQDPDEYRAERPAHRPEQKLDAIEALQRRERGLTVITDATPLLMQADREDIADIVVTTLRDAVQVPVAGLWLYDRDADELQLRAATGPRAVDAEGEMASWAELAWQAYSTDQIYTCADLEEAASTTDTSALRSALFVPIGGDGVLCTAGPTTDAVDATAVRLVQAVATNAGTALERTGWERRFADLRDDLDRYTRATRLLRETSRTVVDAASRSEIESGICERLAELEGVPFAWIGTRGADGITPRAWAGAEQGYLGEGVERGYLGEGDDGGYSGEGAERVHREEGRVNDRGMAPSLRAASTGDRVVVSSIGDRVEADQWRTAALSRGFRSVVSVPITYKEVSYGVVTIYATQSAAFDDLLQSVLADFGQLIAHAVHLAERTTALREHTLRELEFRSTASNVPFLRVARHANCALTVDGCLSAGDDQTIAFATVEGGSRDRIADAVDSSVTISAAEFLRETAEGHVVQFVLRDRFVDSALAEHGAVLRTVATDPSKASIVVDVPTRVDAQVVLETIQERYPDTELVAMRHVDRTPTAFANLQTRLLDQLTDRQMDVLTAAYHAGYFESPREKTGEEVADVLDITSQTFSQHLRRIQRKLFDTLLADSGVSGAGRG